MMLSYMLLFFGVGVILGSLFNKIGKHLPNEERILTKEKCPHCGYQYEWYERVPLLSYFLCFGRCPMCNCKLNRLELFNELATGLLFTFAYYVFGISYDLLIAWTIISIFMIVIVSDFTYYIISDEVLIVINCILMLIYFLKDGLNGMLLHVASGLFLFLVMYSVMIIGNVLLKKESLGGGDIKMMFTFGLILGPIIGLVSIFVSSCIALPVSLIIMYTKKESIIPFGPFLLMSLLLLYFTIFDTSTIINLIRF